MTRTSIHIVGADGQSVVLNDLPYAGLDGLVLRDDGSMLVSSWDASAVYWIDADGQVSVLFSDCLSPPTLATTLNASTC